MKKIISVKSFNKETGELIDVHSKPIEVNVSDSFSKMSNFVIAFIRQMQYKDNFIITFESHNFVEYHEGDIF